ncbi:MAG: stimulus-sensing domain-containing protein [Alphaproteobacteria bacterium]
MRAERRRGPRASRRRGPFSPLTRRILAINVLPLALFLGGLLYLDVYQGELVEAKIAALGTQGEVIAGALGESVVITENSDAGRLEAETARQLVRRLAVPVGTRVRLFDADGALVADSRRLLSAGGVVQTREIPPPETGVLAALARDLYDLLVAWLPRREPLEHYVEAAEQHAGDYAEVNLALTGESESALRDAGEDGTILSVAIPVQRFKRVQGALMLSTTIDDIEDSVREVRYTILKLFALALGVTVLLSVYLAGTIARPVRRLAEAAAKVRHGQDRTSSIPDFTARGDEIGELSGALDDMTKALWRRLDAIESFAADVAHEIKNPLSSLTSAVEAAARVKDPAQQRKLMTVIREDIQRLDRLISDIADASRLDAELSRAKAEPVDLGQMLAALVEVHTSSGGEGGPEIRLEVGTGDRLVVEGVETRLVQVLQNLIHNATSFSPPSGVITLAARRRESWVELSIEDEGPGVPAANLEAIFARFYAARPEGEKFGIHSGLGLSISKQIVEAHGGTIFAENRGSDPERPEGARFVVRLPAESRAS